jgi:hypothetical protein
LPLLLSLLLPLLSFGCHPRRGSASAVAVAFAVACPLVVIPEGDLLSPSSLLVPIRQNITT